MRMKFMKVFEITIKLIFLLVYYFEGDEPKNLSALKKEIINK